MTKLTQYLADKGITQKDFAILIGARQASVSRLAAGVMRPGLQLAVAIERETGGVVSVGSWVKSPLAEDRLQSDKKDAAA